MFQHSKFRRLIALVLVSVLLLGVFGCKTVTNQEVQPETTVTPQVLTVPTVTATPAPTAEPTPDPSILANEQFAALDREIFIDYVSDNISNLNTLVSDPATFEIDLNTVPMTWGDFSEEASRADAAQCETYLERLTAIGREHLSEQNQLSYDILEQYLKSSIEITPYEYYYEPLSQYTGLQINLPIALWLFEIKTEEDIKAYLSLVADTPRYLEQVLAYEQKRAELGYFMTEEALNSVLSDIKKLTKAGNTLFLIEEFYKSVDAVESLSAEQKSVYKEQGKEALSGPFLEAFADLRNGLKPLADSCRKEEGLYTYGDGAKEYFALRLRDEGSCALTPEETLELLEQEFIYLVLSYQTLSMEPEATEDPNLPLTSGDIKQDLADLEALSKTLLPELPAHSYALREVPDELADMSPAAYAVPTVDDWAENNTVILNPAADQTYLFKTLAHEGYPGHMYQYLYQRNIEGLGLMQRALAFSGYYEGWAQFAEELAILAQEKYNRTTTMMAFCNEMATNAMLLAITSIKVNYEGMEPDDLKEYLALYGLGDDATTDLFYSYAVNLPFYALSYAIGYAQLASMMRSLNADLGEAYIQKDVIKRYLDYGPAYFNLIRERMDVWADELVNEG